MKQQIKKIALLCMAFLAVLCLAGCGATVDTQMRVEGGFTGERVIDCRVTSGTVEENYEGGVAALDKLLLENCPAEMSYEKIIEEQTDSGGYSLDYRFTIRFASYEEYCGKVTALLGEEAEIQFTEPDSVFSYGMSLRESFNSIDLMHWARDAIAAAGAVSDMSNLWETGSTQVLYQGEVIDTGSQINFDRIVSNPVQNISVLSEETAEGLKRTIQFAMPLITRDSRPGEVDAYMAEITPDQAAGEWTAEGESYLYTIVFTASDPDQCQQYMQQIFPAGYDMTYVSQVEDAFLRSHFMEEIVRTDNYGEALDFSYLYWFQPMEGRGCDTSLAMPYENAVQYEGYGSEHYMQFSLYDASVAQNIQIHAILNEQDMLDAEVVFIFGEGKSDQAVQAAEYINAQSGQTVATAAGNICMLELKNENCNVWQFMSELHGGDAADFQWDVWADETALKTTYEVYIGLDTWMLTANAHQPDGVVDFSFDPGPAKIDEAYWNGSELEESKAFTRTGVNGIQLYVSAHSYHLVSVLLMVLLVLLAAAALAGGFVYGARKLAERDGLMTAPLTEQCKHLLLVLLAGAGVLLNKIGEQLQKLGGQLQKGLTYLRMPYPEQADPVLSRYFYGSDWPRVILLLGLLIVPAGWIVLNFLLGWVFRYTNLDYFSYMMFAEKMSRLVWWIFLLAIPVALLWHVAERFIPDPQAEQAYDEKLRRVQETLRDETGLEKTGLAAEETTLTEPLILIGPDASRADAELTGWPWLLRILRRLMRFEEHLVIRTGSDGVNRFSCMAQETWYLTEYQIVVYKVHTSLCTDCVTSESTRETFYQNIARVQKETVVLNVYQDAKVVPQVYQGFSVTGRSGTVIRGTADSVYTPNQAVDDFALALQNLVRSQKQMVLEKKKEKRMHRNVE